MTLRLDRWVAGLGLCGLVVMTALTGCMEEDDAPGEPAFIIGRVVLVPDGFESRTTDLVYGFARQSAGINAPIEVVLGSEATGCDLEARGDEGYQVRFNLVASGTYEEMATSFRVLEGTPTGIREERREGVSSISAVDAGRVVGTVAYYDQFGLDQELTGNFEVVLCP